MHPFRYRLYGLTIASAIELPELVAEAGDGADVRIEMVERLTGAGFALPIEGVADFEVEGGTAIRIRPAPGIDPRNVRLFLLGSAMGALLHQRGLLPLHANAVVVDGTALAFTGPSGVGKSTLAMWCHDQGYPVLADDVCVIHPGGGGEAPAVLPGLARLRLWRDALEHSGRAAAAFPLSFAGADDGREKFDVLIDGSRQIRSPVPLRAIATMEFGDDVEIQKLEGTQAVAVIMENTYRGHLVHAIGDPQLHFRASVSVARECAIYRVVRPRDSDRFARVANAILAELCAANSSAS